MLLGHKELRARVTPRVVVMLITEQTGAPEDS